MMIDDDDDDDDATIDKLLILELNYHKNN